MAEDSEGWQTKGGPRKAKKKNKCDEEEEERKEEKGKGSVGAEGGAPPSATNPEDQAAGAAGEPAATSSPTGGATAADAARRPRRPLLPPEGIARCSICGTVMRGGSSALRMHELTSSRCRAMQSGGSGSEGRVPCPHGCGRKIAANDEWALAQHEAFCLKLRDQPPTAAGSPEESQRWDDRPNHWHQSRRPQGQRWWGANYWSRDQRWWGPSSYWQDRDQRWWGPNSWQDADDWGRDRWQNQDRPQDQRWWSPTNYWSQDEGSNQRWNESNSSYWRWEDWSHWPRW